MRTVQDILFNVTGQTLVFDAPEGRPSSVTSVEVYRWDSSDDDTSETSAAGSGSVETNPNTTIDAASGAGQTNPNVLNVAATTGFEVGRRYLVTAADSYKEWFEVAEIDSSNSVTARHPMHNAYSSADTVQSTRITATVDSTWVADETNIDDSAGPNPMFRVRWVYVHSGVTYVADTYFNLVRYGARHGVLPQDVESMFAGWMDALPVDHRNDQGRLLIDEAYRAVKFDLHGIELDDASIAEAEVIDELVRHRTVERFEWAQFLSGRGGDQTRHIAAKQAYQERLDQLLRLAMKVPVRDGDGAGRKTTALGLTVR
jgi:hypothetical protein